MSLDLLELVSLTGNAAKCLENTNPSSDSRPRPERNESTIFDSPFESPRSIGSSFKVKETKNILTDNKGENKEKDRKKWHQDDRSSKGRPTSLSSPQEDERGGDNPMSRTSTATEQDLLSTLNRQETTTSDNNLGSSQGSRKSFRSVNEEKKLATNSTQKEIFFGLENNQVTSDRYFSNHDNDINIEDDNHSIEQPEIIDVPECIIAVRSGVSSPSEEESTFNEIDKVVNANLPLHPRAQDQIFKRNERSYKGQTSQGGLLMQGSLSKGILDPKETAMHGDVYISQLGLSERQRGLKEALSKRAESNYPKRKIVQPHVIPKHSQSEVDSDLNSARSGSQKHGYEADHAITAAVAASAAVAATQPFLKAQQDLDAQMQQFLKQLGDLQGKSEGSPTLEKPQVSVDGIDSTSRIGQLEKKMAELTEKRMELIEKLQQQQMQMQAQLLFLTRSKGVHPKQAFPKTHKVSGENFDIYHATGQVQPSKALGGMSQMSSHVVNPAYSTNNWEAPHSKSSQRWMTPEVMNSHAHYLSEVRELQGSHLDTPAPRKNVPEPTPYSLPGPDIQSDQQRNLGFLEKLLANNQDIVQDTTFDVKGGYSPPTKLQEDRSNNARTDRRGKSPVDTARDLVTSLSKLEQETAESVGNPKTLADYSFRKVDLGPAPLEQYLRQKSSVNMEQTSPQRRKQQRRYEKHLARLEEARAVLTHLETARTTLEGNMEAVLKASRKTDGPLAGWAQGTAVSEKNKIEKMVSKRICALEADIQREVLRGLAEDQAKKLSIQREQERQRLAVKKGGGTTSSLVTQDKKYVARNKPGISTKQSEQSARLAYSRQNINTNANTGNPRGKENRTASKVKPPPKIREIKDEQTMVRTYGRPEYQRGRTRLRDPYMHFQNTKPGDTTLQGPAGASADALRSRSPPKWRQGEGYGYGQEGGQTARQFYFSPTRGYIPLSAGDTGPIEGRLISMAIPLGQPRMERGVRPAVVPGNFNPNPSTSTPVPVTAARNVAMVSFPVAHEQKRSKSREKSRERSWERSREREPELSKQVLPPIDIDSISPSSSRRSDIQLSSPQQAKVNLTFLHDEHDERVLEEGSDLDVTPTENGDDDQELEQMGQGLTYPGHIARPEAEPSGPIYPIQKASTGAGDGWAGSTQATNVQSSLLSDVMAEDLRRRDELEKNAIYWLEQELMAQVLSKVMPVDVAPSAAQPADQTGDIVGAEGDRSEVSAKDDDSLLVADVIGQGGLQLFIDAGQPVDNGLVQALVKEVLQERVAAMLAQGSEGQGQGGQVQNEEKEASPQRKPHSDDPARVTTPEPTPLTSPTDSPRHQTKTTYTNKQAVTPPLSPTADGFQFRPATEQANEVLPQTPSLPPKESENEKLMQLLQQQQKELEELKQQHHELQLQQQLQQQEQQQQLQQLADDAVPDATDAESEPSVSIDISEELRRVSSQGKKVEPEEAVAMRHSVATPPLSPQPIVAEESTQLVQGKRQLTPPPTPPPVKARSPSPASKSEEVEEEEVSEEQSQPQPIMISVAVGEEHPLSSGVQKTRRSPSPKRPQTPVSVATEPSPPPSTESSLSETINDVVSEGQWLLSRSEGQIVPGLAQGVRQQILGQVGRGRPVDVSTASTLRDTDDLDLNMVGPGNKSEGEILLSGLPAPDQDPMLLLLAEAQRNILMGPLPGARARQDAVQSTTGRSLGEMSVGQVPPTRLVQVRSADDRNGAVRLPDQRAVQRRGSSGSLDHSQHSDQDVSFGSQRGGQRSSQRSPQRSPSPQQGRTRSHQQQQFISSGSSRGTRSSRGQMQYQPVLSEGAPLATRGRQGPAYRGGGRRSNDSRISRSADRGTAYSASSQATHSLSRSAESVSFRRSGEGGVGGLTSSFRSRQSSTGPKKSVDFDLSGTQEHLHGSEVSRSSRSMGPTYSLDDSLDETELRRMVGNSGVSSRAPYRMSVTIPSTAGEEDDSDLSEVDLSDRRYH